MCCQNPYPHSADAPTYWLHHNPCIFISAAKTRSLHAPACENIIVSFPPCIDGIDAALSLSFPRRLAAITDSLDRHNMAILVPCFPRLRLS